MHRTEKLIYCCCWLTYWAYGKKWASLNSDSLTEGTCYVGPRNRTHCPNADTKNVHCMCNTNFLKEGTQGNTNLQTLTLLTLCCIWTDQMQIVFEFRSYIDYTETYIQMFLSFHFTTNQPTVQAIDYDKSTWVVLIPLKQICNLHMATPLALISEKTPVQIRGGSDPLHTGTANFSSLVLLLRIYLPPGFPCPICLYLFSAH